MKIGANEVCTGLSQGIIQKRGTWGDGGVLFSRNLIGVSNGQLRKCSARLINSCRQERLWCGYTSVLKCLLMYLKEADERCCRKALQNIVSSFNVLSEDIRVSNWSEPLYWRNHIQDNSHWTSGQNHISVMREYFYVMWLWFNVTFCVFEVRYFNVHFSFRQRTQIFGAYHGFVRMFLLINSLDTSRLLGTGRCWRGTIYV